MWFSIVVFVPVCLLLTILVLDSGFRLILLALSRWRLPVKPVATRKAENDLAYVFAAHNEEGVIYRSGDGVNRPAYVIADNCNDKTAEVACGAGARVWERWEDNGGGKAGALRWFLRVGAAELACYSRLAIFDADSEVALDFGDQMTVSPYDKMPAVQGFVSPLVTGGSPVARLAAFSEILSQRIDDLARVRLGWPVPLRGTGMVFDSSLLPTLLSSLRTKVEDVEMTIQLVRRGIYPQFLYHAVVGDPKPAGMHGVAAQRARWEQGRRQVLRYYWKDLLSLFFSGHPGLMSLSLSLVLRPRALVLLFKMLLAILLGIIAWSHGQTWSFLAVMVWFTVIVDGLYYLIGLAFVKERRAFGLALLSAPAYLIMWIWSQAWSFVSRSAWLSARNSPHELSLSIHGAVASSQLHSLSSIIKRPGAIGA
jgi:cellulose synthase/poly-beta-1,6-N-acetylglucosamine synthase-like glycosyltransferase